MDGASRPRDRDTQLRRVLITICMMTATVMQSLDTTIANVALPYMQGSFSATYDQVAWVLTSYIVASAIATSPTGWLAERFSRKRIFIACATGFTIASVLCGMSQTLEQMVAFRLLQGLCGAGLVPLSQSVLLDLYPPHQRGQAMAIWGMGVMIGPIMGPTLGGWLTEHYSWHWVFLINLPFGIISIVGLTVLLGENRISHKLRFDWLGFLALSAAIGAFQLMLDRGERLEWFESREIIIEIIIAAFAFYVFIVHSLTAKNPFINLELFKDRNFVAGCFFTVMIGLVVFSTMAMITPFLQNVLGYPIIDAGTVIAARGVGTFLAMMCAGRLLKFVEARNLLFAGFLFNALSLYQMSGFTEQTSSFSVFTTGLVGGFGLGLVFIPLNAVAFLSLPGHLRTAGATLTTLVRNVSSSAGISLVVAMLASKTTQIHAHLAENITPFNEPLQMPNAAMLDTGTDRGRALIEQLLMQQSTVMAFNSVFQALMWVCILAMPCLLLVGSSRAGMVKRLDSPRPQPAE